MSGPVDLYYWPTPNGWKITIALEELGLPYEIHWVNIGRGDQFAPEFLKISPNNRMPALVDPDGPDGKPISIFESAAILQYLARKTGKLYGATERDRIEVDQWLIWQVANLGPMAGQAGHFLRYAPAMDQPKVLPYAQSRYRDECHRLYRVLDTRLEDRRFVAGDFFSIADIAIWSWADVHNGHGVSFDDMPNVARWHEEVGSRDAVKRGRAIRSDESDRKLTAEEQKRRNELLYGQTGLRRKSRAS